MREMTVYKIELVEKKAGKVKSDVSVYKVHERKRVGKTRSAGALRVPVIKKVCEH